MRLLVNFAERPEPALSSRNRTGVTLVELTMALAIAAFVVFVAIRAYSTTQENQRIHETVQLINSTHGAVESIYAERHDFSELHNGMIRKSLAKSYTEDESQELLRNPFRGRLEVGGDTVADFGDSYYISISGLTSGQCQSMLSKDFGKHNVAFAVHHNNVPGPASFNIPADNYNRRPGDLAESCANDGNPVAVSWQFHTGTAVASADNGGGCTGSGCSSAPPPCMGPHCMGNPGSSGSNDTGGFRYDDDGNIVGQ